MTELISELEEKLRLAMCNSDIDTLDKLLAPDLLFTNHLGQLISKQNDLAAHREKVFTIDTLELSEQNILPVGNTYIVSVKADIAGNYQGTPTAGHFRFTRVWCESKEGWQVVAGHSTLIAE